MFYDIIDFTCRMFYILGNVYNHNFDLFEKDKNSQRYLQKTHYYKH